MNDLEQLKQLITSSYSCISISSNEEYYALGLVRQAALALNRDLWIWSVSGGVRDGLSGLTPVVPNTDAPHLGLCNFASSKQGAICVTLDIAEYLKEARTLRCWRDLVSQFESSESTLILIDSSDQLPEVVRAYSRALELSLPGPQELFEIVRDTVRAIHNKKPVDVGITRTGLEAVVRNLRGLTRRQAKRIIADVISEDNRFNDSDLNDIIVGKRRMIHHDNLLEYIQTPLDLGEIGGMSKLKRWLELRKEAVTPEAQAFGIKAPRGVLMLGVQGGGKSLTAKAIATAWQQPLLRLDPGTLYNRYIGESENNLRQALQLAESMSPVILWIDEIEKGFASAQSQSSDGGLSQRMFGSLLTWMQEHQAPVFVIATANNIEALPPELLRKGRFDEIFFVDLPGAETRKDIFKIHLTKRKRDPGKFDLNELARVSQGYTGSEIEQGVIAALYEAWGARADITTESIAEALKASPPLSVTMAESMEALIAWANGRCVPVE